MLADRGRHEEAARLYAKEMRWSSAEEAKRLYGKMVELVGEERAEELKLFVI